MISFFFLLWMKTFLASLRTVTPSLYKNWHGELFIGVWSLVLWTSVCIVSRIHTLLCTLWYACYESQLLLLRIVNYFLSYGRHSHNTVLCIYILVMCLSTKGERACAQMKQFKRMYQSISKSIAMYVAIVTIIYIS